MAINKRTRPRRVQKPLGNSPKPNFSRLDAVFAKAVTKYHEAMGKRADGSFPKTAYEHVLAIDRVVRNSDLPRAEQERILKRFYREPFGSHPLRNRPRGSRMI